MKNLRAALTNLKGITPAEQAKLEERFLVRLEAELGGQQNASASYRKWLDSRVAPKPLPVADLTEVIRWEIAHVNAVNYALAECAHDTGDAFFILHLG
jgi:hypothetical protein